MNKGCVLALSGKASEEMSNRYARMYERKRVPTRRLLANPICRFVCHGRVVRDPLTDLRNNTNTLPPVTAPRRYATAARRARGA